MRGVEKPLFVYRTRFFGHKFGSCCSLE
jgi:hypothetical protein